jgi:hypothetical protein
VRERSGDFVHMGGFSTASVESDPIMRVIRGRNCTRAIIGTEESRLLVKAGQFMGAEQVKLLLPIYEVQSSLV